MSIKHVMTAAVLLLCFYAPSVAQDESPLNVKIKDSVREHEPEWQFSREEPAKHSDELKADTTVDVWANGSARLLAIVYEHESGEDADATYKYMLALHKLANTKEAASESYLGEMQNTSVTMDGPDRWYSGPGFKLYVHILKRGSEVLVVVGDTPELVKRFSALIAAEFPAT